MNDMRVSVLVPTFNRANYIGECLDSLLAQTVPALEIIVIDDGSEDGTAELLKQYGPRIRYVRKENGGKPRAVNLGLSLAQGDLVWIFDDDDVALPDAIETRLAALRDNPRAAFVYSPHYYGFDGADGRIVRGRRHELPAHDPERFLAQLMRGCFFHLATALVRIDVYRKIGGFDEELLSSEDYDMQLRLARDYPAALSPAPTFVFRQHSGLRGAKTIRYSGSQRGKVFRRFDQRIGLKLRASLELGDYLVPRRSGPLSGADRRLALLGRMLVMASKGCIAEFFEDLRGALDTLGGEGRLSKAERLTIADALCTGYAYESCLDQWPVVLSHVDGIKRYPSGGSALRSLALGAFNLMKAYPGTLGERWQKLRVAFDLALRSLC